MGSFRYDGHRESAEWSVPRKAAMYAATRSEDCLHGELASPTYDCNRNRVHSDGQSIPATRQGNSLPQDLNHFLM